MIFLLCVYFIFLGLKLPGNTGHLGRMALKNSSLPVHLQLVYLPGEESLLCPQPSGGVGSMVHRAPSVLGHEHSSGEGEGGKLNQNRTNSTDTSRNQRSCSLVKGREALQSGCQTVHLILI